jgi:Fe2+ or Zn2+ uptake regulation protein
MQDHIDRLKQNGLRITSKRRAILEILYRSGKALTPEDIKDRLSARFEKVSYPSVYRNLEDMNRIGILARIRRPDRRLYYALCRARHGVHHHHIICEKCGKVGEIEKCGLFRKEVLKGYRITGHFVQLRGICYECRRK